MHVKCYICKENKEDNRFYCKDCYRKIKEEHRNSILERKYEILEEHSQIEHFKQQIQQRLLQRQSLAEKEIKRGQCLRRIRETVAKIAVLRGRLYDAKITVADLEYGNQTRKENLVIAENSFVILRDKVLNWYPQEVNRLLHQKSALIDTLAARRRMAITEMMSVFPLMPSTEEECVLVNIRFPNTGKFFSQIPSAAVATGMGYIVHLVILVASYINVALPNRLVFFGSQSYVFSNAQKPQRYSLYGNNVKEIEEGFRLLCENVSYLCFSQGLRIRKKNLSHILPNLRALFRYQLLGREGPRNFDILPENQNRGKEQIVDDDFVVI